MRQQANDKKALFSYLQDNKALFHLQMKSKAANSVENMFYQTDEMKNNYAKYQDVIFLNRKIYRTRFNRKFLLFQGVDHESKTCVFGVAV
jgi:hypothetical protein